LTAFVGDLAIDAAGDLFVAGWSTSQGSTDGLVARFDQTGALVWSVSYDNGGNEQVSHLALTPSGNVVVAGTYTGPEPDPWQSKDTGIFVAVFDPSGQQLQDARFYASVLYDPVAVAVDASGAIYLAGDGESADFGGGQLPDGATAYLVKLDATGKHAWSHGLGGADHTSLYRIALSPDGHVAVSGARDLPVDAGTYPVPTQSFVQSHDAAGKLAWTRDVDMTALPGGPALAFAPDGTLIVAGGTKSPDGYDQVAAVARIDAAGDVVKEQLFGGHAYFNDVEVSVDPGAGVILCGDFQGQVDLGQGELETMPYIEDTFVAKLGTL
jgi:outer membrane protein assembly factor BamB